ncbi:hypothetical protein VTK73DRAFT_7342 [Phialemonium thermophilum]|uniref:Uncharacterized protein n=1 Tax=Phialemonium thermophilum TaxID=223376 RepID=A0ABR3WFG2_9PEZI
MARGSAVASEGGAAADYEPWDAAGLAGAHLLRRKQGREAWREAGTASEEGGSGTGGAGGRAGEDEDWDIERAVERRLVQIMFTVPKERLRVVNAEVEAEEEAAVVEDVEHQAEKGGGESSLDGPPCREDQHGEVREACPGAHADREVHEGLLASLAGHEDGRRSPPATLHTAEAVKLERPRTKVLEMVESIESLSRKNSPASSPSR